MNFEDELFTVFGDDIGRGGLKLFAINRDKWSNPIINSVLR